MFASVIRDGYQSHMSITHLPAAYDPVSVPAVLIPVDVFFCVFLVSCCTCKFSFLQVCRT